jgi:DNA-binding response OmpR family regulator
MMDAYQKEIAALRQRVAYLEGEVEYLKDTLSPKINPFAGKLSLSPQQALLTQALYNANVATQDFLDEIMEGFCHQSRSTNNYHITGRVKVTICKLRHKLAKHGVHIQTVRGIGYKMPDFDKRHLAKVCGL